MAALSFDVQRIPVGDIFVVRERRPLDAEAVSRLAQSIRSIDLRTPITVRVEDVTDPESGEVFTAYGLVTGHHRLAAFRQLGRDHIPAIVRDCDLVEAELWEIAENLHRSDLTKQQRDEHIRRYAELIERKEAAATECRTSLADGRVAGPQHQPGTAKRVAKETGLNIRTVQRVLSDKPKVVAPLDDDAARERQIGALMSAWNKASQEAREEFLERIEQPVFDRGRAA